jgi:molybdopterin-guanine dinucleotide biosynthesis protein A
MPALMDLSIVIQAGGSSSRMGRNKALMLFQGQPLIARVLDRVRPMAAEVIITTNDPEDFAFLNVRLVPDIIAGIGALGGLYTALRAASVPLAAVVACDMPFVNPALLAAERSYLVNEQVDAVLPVLDHGYEPFHAVFRVDTCLPAVQKAIDAGQRRAIAWMPDVKVRAMQEHDVRQYDPHLLAFLNVNTPEEFQRAEEIAARMEN